jgi:peptide/nickel transport system substrate-binding protein
MTKPPVFLSAVVLLFMAGGAGTATTPAPKTGGTVRFGLSKDIQSLNPFQRTTAATKNVATLAFECLLTADENGVLKPALATSWEASRDALQYTFKLRGGVRFHHGKEMTAQDVIWSMQYAMDPKNFAYGRSSLSLIASLVAPDPLTLRVILKEPYVPLFARFSNIQAFPIVPQGAVPPGREKVELYPPGTGPFVMTDYKPNQLVAFKRFDRYWQKGLPYVQEIMFKPNEDDTIRFTALRAGEFDIIERIPNEQALRIQKGEIKDIVLEPATGAGHRSVLFNTEKAPFDNVKVRQALAHAIDRAKILEGTTWGFGVVADQRMLKGSPWYVPLTERKRDLEKARALLREAGFPGGLKVKAQTEKRFEAEMLLIQSQLKDAGIDLDLEFYDFAKHQASVHEGSYFVTTIGASAAIDPDMVYYDDFHTEKGASKTHNYARYSNPRLDRLLENGRVELDPQKRYRIYKEVVELLHEELPRVSLGFTRYMFAFRGYVKGFQTNPDGFYNYGVGGLTMTWLDR